MPRQLSYFCNFCMERKSRAGFYPDLLTALEDLKVAVCASSFRGFFIMLSA